MSPHTPLLIMAVLDTANFFAAGKKMPASSAGMMRRSVITQAKPCPAFIEN
jgi:hypothetical protein